MDEKTQMDRIERKLDEVLAFRDLLLRLALPRIPQALRAKAAAAMAGSNRT
jgi:hypothetical protein